MPVQVSYPGVYIEEVPSGLHTITGVATSICAFVGVASRGPVNVATEIFAFADFEQTFGGLALNADGSPQTLGFAVRDFFVNGGSDAFVVRVGRSDATAASVVLGSQGKTADGAVAKDKDGKDLTDVLTLRASSSGAWGNSLYAQVDTVNTRDTASPNPPAHSALFNLTIIEFADGQTLKSERFLNLSMNPADATYVVGYLAANSELVRAEPAAAPANATFPSFAPKALFPGPAATTSPAPPAAKPPAPQPTDGFVQFGKDKAGKDDPASQGGDGKGDFDVIGSADKKTGIYALDAVDIFNILSLPAAAPVADAEKLKAISDEAAAYCQVRRAIYIIDPPDSWTDPSVWKASSSDGLNRITGDLTTLRGGSSSYAVVYFPQLREPNPLHKNQLETFAASGAIAGIFARTDAARGVWKAPAGLEATLTGVAELSITVGNAENGKLNQIGVNCLRTFPLVGSVVWGARTLDGADRLESDYKYVPVRRFTLFLEESLYRGTQWVVFEPNDEPLWSQIRLNVGAFLHDLFRQGAFAGATPQQAYFVQCDSKTTTQSDINNGIVNILVGFAPLKPAEFVILKIQQITGQIDT